MNLLASAAPPDFSQDFWTQMSPSRGEWRLVLMGAAVITFLALIWAVFIRKRQDDSSRRYTYPRLRTSSANGAATGTELPTARKSRRRRRRRHRRNPTLAETGGLPPIRSEGPPDDPP